MDNTVTIYDIRATAKALNRKVQVYHASDLGEEARAFTLYGSEADVRKLASMLISTSGAFLQVGPFQIAETGLCHGQCHLAVVMAPDIKGIPRRDDPTLEELEDALFLIVGFKVPPGNPGLAIAVDGARRVLGLPEPTDKELP